MSQLSDPALAAAADQVLQTGVGLAEPDVLAVLRLPDEELPAALELAHQVRMRWCGPEVRSGRAPRSMAGPACAQS